MGLFTRTPDKTPLLAAEIAGLNERLSSMQAQLTESRQSYAQAPSTVKLQQTGGLQYQRDRAKLFDAYRSIPWISAPLDAIAHRMTSGGYSLEAVGKNANPANKETIDNLFLFCNPEEDLIEICQMTILSMLIFGESYWEVVEASSEPHELYYINATTMTTLTDARGAVTGYLQTMEDGTKETFTPEEILRFPLRGPLGETLSPIEKVIGSATLYNQILRWAVKFFEHGARPNLQWVGPESFDDINAGRFQTFWEENYAGVENAHKDVVTFGGMEAKAIPGPPLEMDFLTSIKYLREEFLSVLGVPPSAIAVSDNGNRLSDMSDTADKQFRFNTINPLRRIVEEKVTYRLIQQGMGIDDWVFRLAEQDYRSDDSIVKLVVEKVNAGLLTRDEGRKQLGEAGELGKGGSVAAISLSREVVPVSDLEQIHGTQFQQAQSTAITTGLDPHEQPTDLAQASPRDPTASDDTHPVNVQDQQFQQKAKNDKEKDPEKESALDDLKRWQRVALKALKEGKTQRVFESESIDAVTAWAVAQSLRDATTEAAVREIFDCAFTDVRE